MWCGAHPFINIAQAVKNASTQRVSTIDFTPFFSRNFLPVDCCKREYVGLIPGSQHDGSFYHQTSLSSGDARNFSNDHVSLNLVRCIKFRTRSKMSSYVLRLSQTGWLYKYNTPCQCEFVQACVQVFNGYTRKHPTCDSNAILYLAHMTPPSCKNKPSIPCCCAGMCHADSEDFF